MRETFRGDGVSYRRHSGGHGWRILPDGRIEIEDEGVVRTLGEPKSMRLMLDCYGIAIDEASCRFGVRKATIMAMIAIEAGRRDGLYFDEHAERYESHIDQWSGGLMQTLERTANGVEDRFHLYGRRVTRQDMKCSEMSIMLGVGYLAMLVESHTHDPVLLCAAYNAGGVYTTSKNRWNLRTYGDGRIDRFVAWYNDALAVMGES